MSGAIALHVDEPLIAEAVASLDAGAVVSITGSVLTLRDASAVRLAALIQTGSAPPAALEGRLLYAVGPSPAMPGRVAGSAGPTTTARMAGFLPALLSAGVRGVIGKGELDASTTALFARHGAVYLAAVGGAGALLAQHIVSMEVLAFEELGTEALQRLELRDFPAIVAVDAAGRNLHARARQQWRRRS